MLRNKSKNLLKKCILNQNPSLFDLISDKNILNLNTDDYNELREAVCDELMENGFEIDFKITQYGIELENLIDELGSLFL